MCRKHMQGQVPEFDPTILFEYILVYLPGSHLGTVGTGGGLAQNLCGPQMEQDQPMFEADIQIISIS
jgi:hypothetical protein